MYLPRHFRMDSLEAQHALMAHYPFATLVTVSSGDIEANPLPLLLNPYQGEHGVLEGHIARANPLWKTPAAQAMAMFHGPDSYITPSSYPAKRTHGRVVLTWHYLSVQAHGTLRFIEGPDWLKAHVARLTDRFEQGQATPWSIGDAPQAYIDGLCQAIVGIELSIERLIGKHKAAQHKDEAAQQAVCSALKQQGMSDSEAGWLSGAPFTRHG
ncbi:FMN-binding negative transcriptional regulator [Kushneria marisflavi]|uniref:Transcriptional regulator n=1 Tax=Kushneria marisflavi TaxID=157779 RepID=A0A240UQQ0_9GAMM|nr:FMN-binding negative transcriptional regulator [Kushneria marisflavi]ART63456.1 transcriptional regulator [Kushneria marisflavi]RKD84517.1 PaiB family negative transcriptional regulator [Kushneria marisflavi]